MAFYEEEDEEGQGTGPQTLGAESGTVGSGASAQAAGDAAAASAPKPEPFVGISQYINANRPQSEKLAGQVVGNIETKAQGFDSALNNAQTSFNQAADSQKVEADDNLFGEVKTNATSVVNDPNKKSSFDKLKNASYTGPQSIEEVDSGNSWAGIQSALQKARTAKEQAGTESGRMGLIKEISNNPRQSQGALVFDNLLLQSNPNAAGMLQNAGAGLNQADTKLATAKESAAAKAKAIKDQNAAVSSQAKQAVQQGYDNLFGAQAGADGKYGTADDVTVDAAGSLKAREAAKRAAQSGAFREAQKRINAGEMTDEDYGLAGVTKDAKLYGTKLGPYLQMAIDANTKNVATEDDYARQEALAALMGESGPTILNPTTDRNLIGTAGKGYSYNQGGLSENIATNKRSFENEYAQAFGDKNPETLQPVIDWLYSGGPRPAGWVPDIEDEDQARSEVLTSPANQWMKDVGAVLNKYDMGGIPEGWNTFRGGLVGPMGSGA